MDLRLLDAEPSDAEREAIDAVAGAAEAKSTRVARADHSSRHLLLPALRAAQRRVGWVSPGALGYAARRLTVPPADAYGVASFYALLALDERPAEVLHVCDDLACRLRGAEVPEGAQASPCLGLCERAPASLLVLAGPEPREVQLPETGPPLPQFGDPSLRLLRRVGIVAQDFQGLDTADARQVDVHQDHRRLSGAGEFDAESSVHRGD